MSILKIYGEAINVVTNAVLNTVGAILSNKPLDVERMLSAKDLRPFEEMFLMGYGDNHLKEEMGIDYGLGVMYSMGGSRPGYARMVTNNFGFFADYDKGKEKYVVLKIAYLSDPSKDKITIMSPDDFPHSTTIYQRGKCIPHEPRAMWEEIRILGTQLLASATQLKQIERDRIAEKDRKNLTQAEQNSRNKVREILLNPTLHSGEIQGIDSYLDLLKKRSDGKEIALSLSVLYERVKEIRANTSERIEDGPSLYSYSGEVLGKILPELLDPYLALPAGNGTKEKLTSGQTAQQALLEQIKAVSERIDSWQSPRQIAQIQTNQTFIDDILSR